MAFLAALLVICPAVLAVSPESCEDVSAVQLTSRRLPEFPGLGPGGNPVPAMTTSNVVLDQETLECKDPRWQHTADGLWTFRQIADAYLVFGAKKFYKPGGVPDPLTQCVGALVIAAGECQETSQTLGLGCNGILTKDSGVFQLDFLRTGHCGEVVNPQIQKDGGIMNLCISGFGAGYLTAAPWVDEAKSLIATLEDTVFQTCNHAPPYVNNYSCPDPLAVPGVLYPNYIGAFCHKWFASRWSTCDLTQTTPRCCGLFNGGANAGRDKYPFPEYYYAKAQKHLDAGADFTQTCIEALAGTT